MKKFLFLLFAIFLILIICTYFLQKKSKRIIDSFDKEYISKERSFINSYYNYIEEFLL